MGDKTVVETIYGKHHKYEIVRDSGVFSTHYYVRRDGEAWKGSFSTLSAAVEAAKKAG